jgi:aryl-alcohol dehydrogenase-like predicted oxidoreductase
VNVQNNYSVLDRTVEAEVIPACEARHHFHALFPARERCAHRRTSGVRAGGRGSRRGATGRKGCSRRANGRRRPSHGVREGSRAHAAEPRSRIWRARRRLRASSPATSPEQVKANAAARRVQLTDARRAEEVGELASAGELTVVSGPVRACRHDRARTRALGRHQLAGVRGGSSPR